MPDRFDLGGRLGDLAARIDPRPGHQAEDLDMSGYTDEELRLIVSGAEKDPANRTDRERAILDRVTKDREAATRGGP